MKELNFSRIKKIILTLFALFLISLCGMIYFYRQAHTDATVTAKNELEQTIADVGKLLVLPQNETPSLATVSDPSKLQDQKFFANAKSGDKVLIYSLAKKAILYSPSLHKVVEVAPVNLGTNSR